MENDMPAPTGAEVWRDFVTDMVPSSGVHQPSKADARAWAAWLESLVTSGVLSSGPWFATQASMTLGYAANTIAVVYADPDAAKNGLYRKNGASGAGSWSQLTSFLPGYQFVTASPTGASTPNAIVAVTSPRLPAVDGVALVTLAIPATNTASPVTVAFDGGAPLAIKDVTGADPAAGSLMAGMMVAGFRAGGSFRLITDYASAVHQSAAKEWANNAEDVPVSTMAGGDGITSFSARHWAAKSSEQADRSENEALRSEAARSGSESARDQAAGYVNDIVSEKEVPITATRNGMEAIAFLAGMNSLETRGFASMGDDGGARYVRVAVEPTHGLKVRSLDRYLPDGGIDAVNGGWWELAEPVLFAEMAGVVANGSVDDRAAINRAFRYIEAKGGGTLVLPPRNMRMSGFVGWCSGLSLQGTPGKTKFTLDRGVFTDMFANLQQAADIPIDDLTICGVIFDANADGTENFAASAVTVNGYRRLRVRDCIFENATGYGLGLEARQNTGDLNAPQDECWLEDSVFRNNGHNTASDQHDGLDMKSANKLWAKNLIAYGNGDKGLDFRGLYVTVEDCISYDNATFGISISSNPTSAGGTEAIASLRGLTTFNNGTRGVQIALGDGSIGSSVLTLDDIKSFGNALDGIIITDPYISGNFRLTGTNIHCWGNAQHGFNDNTAGGKLKLTNGIFEGNGLAGAATAGSNRAFVACKFLANGTVGFDEVLSAANNKLIGCDFDGNVLGPTSLNTPGDTELIGCTGVPTGLILGRPAPNWVNRVRIEGRGTNGAPRVSAEGADTNIPLSFSTKGSGLYQWFIGNFGTEIIRAGAPAGGNTALLLAINKSGSVTLKQVSFGADDSAGSGYMMLRVPN